MAENPRTNDKPAERKPATPAEVSKATGEVSALLAPFSPAEQSRIIRAAASINGLEQRQQGKR